MSNLICKDCKSTDVTAYTPGIFGDSRHRCNSCGKISFTADFVEPTLFDRITASPEVLAEKFIFKEWHPIARCYVWYSLLLNSEERLIYAPAFATKEETIAATVEELNKVSK